MRHPLWLVKFSCTVTLPLTLPEPEATEPVGEIVKYPPLVNVPVVGVNVPAKYILFPNVTDPAVNVKLLN